MAGSKMWLLLVLSFTTVVFSSEAYVFYAGGHDGWVLDPAESYNHWAGRNRFQINDTIVFAHGEGEADDSVLLVTEQDFDTCNTHNPLRRLDDAGGRSEFRFGWSGSFFFISGDEDRCQKGKKLYVVVMAVRPKESAQAPAPGSPLLGASAPEYGAEGPGDEGMSRLQAPPPKASAARLDMDVIAIGLVAGVLGALVL